jgi:hypothetical protein
MSSENELTEVTRRVLSLHGENIKKVKKLIKTVKRYLKLEKLTECNRGEIKRLYDVYKADYKLMETSSSIGNAREPPPCNISASTGPCPQPVQSTTKSFTSLHSQSLESPTKQLNTSPEEEMPNDEIELISEQRLRVVRVGMSDMQEERLRNSPNLQLINKTSKLIQGTPEKTQRRKQEDILMGRQWLREEAKVSSVKPEGTPEMAQRLKQQEVFLSQEPPQVETNVPPIKEWWVKSKKLRNNFPLHKTPPGKPRPGDASSLNESSPKLILRKPPKRNVKASKTNFLKTALRSSGLPKKRRLINQGSRQDLPHTKHVKKDNPSLQNRDRTRSWNDPQDHRHSPQSHSDHRSRKQQTYNNRNKFIRDQPPLSTKRDLKSHKRDKRISTGEEQSTVLPWRQENYISGSVSSQQPGKSFLKPSGQRPTEKNVLLGIKPSLDQKLNSGETQKLDYGLSSLLKDQDMTAKKEILRYAINSFVHNFENIIPSLQVQKKYLVDLCTNEFLKSFGKLYDVLKMHGLLKAKPD